MIDKYRETFKEEAHELLAELETSLLELEGTPDDPELIGRVFRAMHTLKGSGAMFGFDDIATFTHELETVFDLVRNGSFSVSKALVTLTLAATDRIKMMLQAAECGAGVDSGETAVIVAELKRLVSGASGESRELPAVRPPLTLEDFLAVMTEYEVSRLNVHAKKKDGIFGAMVASPLSAVDGKIAEIVDRIKRDGELITKIPDLDGASADTVSLKLLIASSRGAAYLGERLGITPCEIDITSFLGGKRGDPAPAESVTYRIRFSPKEHIFLNGTNPVTLLNELRGLGPSCVVAQTGNIPILPKINPESCYIHWDVILTSNCGIDAIKDVFIFVEDDCDLRIEPIGSGVDGIEQKKLGEMLVERGDLSRKDLDKVLAGRKRIGEELVESGLVPPDRINAALAEQQHVKDLARERQNQESVSSIRVPAEKLDILVNLVGELVTVQARLSQTAALRDESILTSIAEEVERLTAELRDNALNIRMLPIGTTFSRFQRLVRDLSGELGKEVVMTTEGAETELDKTVIEKLHDPLVHLIRNSIDHGIEPPEVRVAAGKPRRGTVHLAALHAGDSVLITIRDDGAGIDKESVRAKAVEKGMILANAELSDQEIYAQIFAPGFSTAAKVTSVSGRGVGMDVVKRAIDALRGTIEVLSQRGTGTVITVRIPLTLAIIESLLVRIGDDRFVLPLSIVDECVELSRADVANAHGRNLASVRGRLVPFVPLREQFAVRGDAPDIEQIVITRIDGRQVGFVVDHVIGEHQTVIKSLGRMYKKTAGVSGATILGDGSVALILDAAQLAHAAEVAERAV